MKNVADLLVAGLMVSMFVSIVVIAALGNIAAHLKRIADALEKLASR